MRILAAALVAVSCAGCMGPTWPADQFPAGLEVKRTLFAGGGGGFRETCEAMVVELTDAADLGITRQRVNGRMEHVPPPGWNQTPIGEDRGGPTYYEAAFGGCSGGRDKPLGDLPGALTRPGAYYKVINGGEGIGIIAPRAKLAGFFYFG